MCAASGSAATLAEYLVRTEVGHLVSSPSMVSRAYLVDSCNGVVVDAGERGLWLASVLSALAPDPDGLRVRAAAEGGIPVEHGIPRLVKITLGWSEGSADLTSPSVVAGSRGIGVVSLAVPASLVDRIRSGDGPRSVVPSGDRPLGMGDRVGVVVISADGPLVRWARVASDIDFGGRPGSVALDIGLPVAHSGSPVFVFSDTERHFCGVVDPLDSSTSVLLPMSALAEAVSTAS